MAGVVTLTEQTFSGIQKVTFDWTSSAGGAADATTTEVYTGVIERVVQIPGVETPTAAYDVVVNDSDGADVLLGLGANLSEAVTTQKVAADKLGTVAVSKLTLAVTNAGNAKTGKTILYIRTE